MQSVCCFVNAVFLHPSLSLLPSSSSSLPQFAVEALCTKVDFLVASAAFCGANQPRPPAGHRRRWWSTFKSIVNAHTGIGIRGKRQHMSRFSCPPQKLCPRPFRKKFYPQKHPPSLLLSHMFKNFYGNLSSCGLHENRISPADAR
jgi:hypothetical protein